MRTFEISLGNGVTEVVDLGDDSPMIQTFEAILVRQEHLKTENAKLTEERDKALARTVFYRTLLQESVVDVAQIEAVARSENAQAADLALILRRKMADVMRLAPFSADSPGTNATVEKETK